MNPAEGFQGSRRMQEFWGDGFIYSDEKRRSVIAKDFVHFWLALAASNL